MSNETEPTGDYKIADLVRLGWGCHDHLRRKIVAGEIPHYRVGRLILVRRETVEKIRNGAAEVTP